MENVVGIALPPPLVEVTGRAVAAVGEQVAVAFRSELDRRVAGLGLHNLKVGTGAVLLVNILPVPTFLISG
jgi:hypothetical protein